MLFSLVVLLRSAGTSGSSFVASRGFPVPNILAFLDTSEGAFTGSLTLRGNSFNLGRWAALSEIHKAYFHRQAVPKDFKREMNKYNRQ